jgi:hypothetical protein
VIISRRRLALHVTRTWESRGKNRISVGRPYGRRLLGRPRRRLEDNIKIDHHEVEWEGMDWIDLVQEGNKYGLL